MQIKYFTERIFLYHKIRSLKFNESRWCAFTREKCRKLWCCSEWMV